MVKAVSLLWLLPKRAYLRRFRTGRTVIERVLGNDIVVLPEVFNPVVFRTGRYFAEVLNAAALPGLDCSAPAALDVGTGSGVLAIATARRGYHVDAVDRNPEAVRCARMNVMLNKLEQDIDVHVGDLFSPVAGKKFDLITFSPPSFRGEPTSKFDMSWRASDVFERFAAAVTKFLKPGGLALVLQTSHGDELGLLKAFADYGLSIDVITRKHFGVEFFSVYMIRNENLPV